MNIYNHQPRFIQYLHPAPIYIKKKERKEKEQLLTIFERHIIYTVNITARTVDQLGIHSKVLATKAGSL